MNRSLWTLFFFVFFTLFCTRGAFADEEDDYVKEVLEEDQQNYRGDEHYYEDDDLYAKQQEERMRQQEDAERQRQNEAERQAKEEADRIAAEREKKFQAELSKMNAEQQKAAKQQKKRDAKIVQSVLKAAEQERLYEVLGIRNWKLRIPSREVNIASFSFTIPGFTLKQTTSKDIKKAYRNRAMTVHPDKNRDGRAQEAFIAVENAASILTDKSQRARYDEYAKEMRLDRRRQSTDLVLGSLGMVRAVFMQAFKAVRSVLGPFATPVIILGALML